MCSTERELHWDSLEERDQEGNRRFLSSCVQSE